MIKALGLLLVITLSMPTHIQGAPESPCPDVFTYEPLGKEPGRWYGIVDLSSVMQTAPDPVTLNIVLDSKADILVNWIGEITTTDNKDFKIENTEKKISPGSSQTIRFYVQYNPLDKPPKIHDIRLNGKDICEPIIDVRAEGTSRSPPTSIITPGPTMQSATGSSGNSNDYECGKVVLNNNHHLNALVTNGMPTLEGQWPWQIALYKTELVDNKFMCGGTLVTRQHVVTAGHCVTERGTDILFNRNALTVYLGKHNLLSSVDGVQVRYVSSITLHPEYNGTAVSKDLSILKLREPITISNWVRPACLWPDDKKDLSNVIGKNGSVVGWGYDESGYPTKELTHVEMPVVDHLTCIRSFSEFYSSVTSDYTLCAGFRDGRSVCNGDSGGGMVFNMENAWYLRALVSLTAALPNESRCNPKHYVVFTDLAQFLPWIKDHIAS